MIYGGIPQFTVAGAVVLWQPTIRLEGRTTGGFVHWNHSNTGAMYWGKLLCLVFTVIFGHCCILYQKDVCLEVSRTIHTTNMACSTLWLQCRCTAVTPNQFYIVGGHSYWCMDYAWGCHFQWYTMGYAPKFTALAVHPGVFCDTQGNNRPGGVGFMHWVHSSINEEYQGKLLWMVLAMRYIHG